MHLYVIQLFLLSGSPVARNSSEVFFSALSLMSKNCSVENLIKDSYFWITQSKLDIERFFNVTLWQYVYGKSESSLEEIIRNRIDLLSVGQSEFRHKISFNSIEQMILIINKISNMCVILCNWRQLRQSSKSYFKLKSPYVFRAHRIDLDW